MKTNADNQTGQLVDLEIKDAQLIFDRVWTELEQDYGKGNLHFPTEIFWINGAPGAGKGTHTRTVMQYRDFTAAPIVMSDLLQSPEAQARKDAGMLVGDTEVVGLLFRRLLEPIYQSGAVVDGFPRTNVQVEVLKLFHNRLNELSSASLERSGTSIPKIRKPNFHILVLFVDEEESVRRQFERGKRAMEHNKEVEASGMGEKEDIRATDFDAEKARSRYRVFKEKTYEPLKSLRKIFHFHFINTQLPVEKTRLQIIKELEYQSSLELNQQTFEHLSQIPVASNIVKHARQHLIERLDDYERLDQTMFKQVLRIIQDKFMPIVERHAISGRASVSSEDEIFENDLALAMLIDIFSERGYHAVVDIRLEEVPHKIVPTSWEIVTRTKKVYRVTIFFQGSEIRRGR